MSEFGAINHHALSFFAFLDIIQIIIAKLSAPLFGQIMITGHMHIQQNLCSSFTAQQNVITFKFVVSGLHEDHADVQEFAFEAKDRQEDY
tara:strand:+ start:822 stop:1091 length:270 start_codon:yes stop_codon:yes gene_type:complete